ncbi:MAG: TspO/MBR family protein [Methanocella sp.]
MEIPVDSKDIPKLAASLALSFAAAIIGALAVTPNIAWQDTLSKPFFAPPNWLFGPAWAVLFLLMAIAFYLVWQKWPAKEAKWAMALYMAQLALNVLWNYLFFGMHWINLGLVEIIVLLAMITLTVNAFYRVDKRAAYLMTPYLLWVAFATCLNAALWLLNP